MLGEDAATAPPVNVPTSENISSDSTQETKTSLGSEKSDDAIRDLEPSVDVVNNLSEKINENGDTFQRVFAEATSQNSGVANE